MYFLLGAEQETLQTYIYMNIDYNLYYKNLMLCWTFLICDRDVSLNIKQQTGD